MEKKARHPAAANRPIPSTPNRAALSHLRCAAGPPGRRRRPNSSKPQLGQACLADQQRHEEREDCWAHNVRCECGGSGAAAANKPKKACAPLIRRPRLSCARACARACVRACARACARACNPKPPRPPNQQEEMLGNLCAIVPGMSAEQARQLLEASKWDAGRALDKHFHTKRRCERSPRRASAPRDPFLDVCTRSSCPLPTASFQQRAHMAARVTVREGFCQLPARVARALAAGWLAPSGGSQRGRAQSSTMRTPAAF